nr:helix-turn-helix domain-containing protein [Chitinophaga sp. XS-30]
MVLQGRYDRPLRIELSGILDKITIAFKPLGLNPFISRPFSEVARDTSQVFTDWSDDIGCKAFLDAFYSTGAEDERIDILETYLLSRYRPLEGEDLLLRALAMLTDFDSEHSIPFIAEHISMTPRSFHRFFHKNLGLPPANFRKIARFRHAMQNRMFSSRFRSLTEIGYKSNFSDQSYFIRIYKEMTGDNPRKLFSSIDKLADDHVIFKFIKDLQ